MRGSSVPDSDRGIMIKKRRVSGKVVKLSPDEVNHQRADGEQIVVEKPDVKRTFGNIFNLLAFFAGVVVLLLIGIYLAVSATLMNFTSVEDKVVWNLYGVVPDSEDDEKRIITAASNSPAHKGFWGKMKTGITGVEEPLTGEVVSDKFDDISSQGDTIHINGQPTEFKGYVDSKKLDNEYLVKCMSGSCEKDSYIIVPSSNVVGNVYGYLSWEHGLEKAE